MHRVLIVEDIPLIREAIASDIENADGFSIAAQVACLEEARAVDRESFDIVLLDIGLPDGSGIEFLEELRAANFSGEVLILSALGDEKTVLHAIESGATGYLLKDAAPAQLIEDLHKLVAGEALISPRIAQILMQQLRSSSKPKPQQQALTAKQELGNESVKSSKLPGLSPRESEVLELLAKGKSYKEVSKELDITFHTVAHYAKQIYNKLAVNSKSEAIYKALNEKIISL